MRPPAANRIETIHGDAVELPQQSAQLTSQFVPLLRVEQRPDLVKGRTRQAGRYQVGPVLDSALRDDARHRERRSVRQKPQALDFALDGMAPEIRHQLDHEPVSKTEHRILPGRKALDRPVRQPMACRQCPQRGKPFVDWPIAHAKKVRTRDGGWQQS